jgi:hypothetical protein
VKRRFLSVVRAKRRGFLLARSDSSFRPASATGFVGGPTGDGLSTGQAAITADADYVNNCLLSPSDNSMLTASVQAGRTHPHR